MPFLERIVFQGNKKGSLLRDCLLLLHLRFCLLLPRSGLVQRHKADPRSEAEMGLVASWTSRTEFLNISMLGTTVSKG